MKKQQNQVTIITNKEKKVTLNGKRVRQEMELRKDGTGALRKDGTGEYRRFTNNDLAKLLFYSHEKSVSKYLHGVAIDRVRAENLAKSFGVRLEYLLGNDDWRTEEDKLNQLNTLSSKKYQATISFLHYLGYDLEIMPYWHTTSEHFFDEFPSMEEYISNNGKSLISSIEEYEQTRKHSLEISQNNNSQCYIAPTDCYIELSKLPPKLKESAGYTDFNLNRGLYRHSSDSFLMIYGNIEMRYKISCNGEYLGTCAINKISSFLHGINASVLEMSKSALNWQCLLSDDYDSRKI